MNEYRGPRLFVDMDGTLARFHDQVNYLERMFEKDFFRDLEPFENMVEAIKLFIQEHPNVEVFILSARVNGEPPYCEEEKNAWMDQYLPEIDRAHRIYTEVGKSKAEYIPGGVGKNDYLLDDYNKGLNLWLYDGGSAIKCHNNINQRGLGAYGGSAGMLWIGDMVHTNDTPEMICAELAGHMGLSYDLNKVLSSSKEKIEFTEFKPGSRLNPNPFTPGVNSYLTRVLADKYNPEKYEAKCTSPHYRKMDFTNPLNAIRWLEGSELGFNEFHLQCSDGTKFSVPYFQANDLASNLYGCSIQDLLLRTNNPSDIADSFMWAMEESQLPIVGYIHYLGANGQVGETAFFHSVQEMKDEIADCEDCGRPIRADWLVKPKEVTLYCTPDMGAPEVFTISPDNLKKAAEQCGFPIDDIDEFLCEYTWAESSQIWNDYAQYVDKIAQIMDGFGKRDQVESEFFSIVSTGCSALDAAQVMLTNIEEWARWQNEDAVKAGVLDKAIDYHMSLSGAVPRKSSLDDIISSAKGKQPDHDSEHTGIMSER